jgi:hypothetical protein
MKWRWRNLLVCGVNLLKSCSKIDDVMSRENPDKVVE